METYGFDLRGQYVNFEIAPGAQLNIASNVGLKNFCTVEVGAYGQLHIERSVFINSSSVIRCLESIRIGAFTLLGDGVKLYDMNHVYDSYHVEALTFSTAPISIGRHCWLGANSVVLKGVTIGDHVIIGAGCVIHKDIPAHSLVYNDGGRLVIKPRPQFDHHVVTFTASDTLEHLAFLLEAMPEVAFHVVAGTHISPHLTSFRSYPNAQIYANINDYEMETELLARADLYLDINHWWEIKDAISRSKGLAKPILAFDTTVKQPELTDLVLSTDQPQAMVEAIRNYLNKGKE